MKRTSGLLLALALSIIFWNCSSEPRVEFSDTVKLEFFAALTDGTVIDSVRTDTLMTLTIGEGQIFPAIEEKLVGLKIGDSLTVVLPPEKGFGFRQDRLIGRIPRSAFPDTINPVVGMAWTIPSPNGMLYAQIVEISGDSITIDTNHPLAGETVIYHLTVMEIEKGK